MIDPRGDGTLAEKRLTERLVAAMLADAADAYAEIVAGVPDVAQPFVEGAAAVLAGVVVGLVGGNPRVARLMWARQVAHAEAHRAMRRN